MDRDGAEQRCGRRAKLTLRGSPWFSLTGVFTLCEKRGWAHLHTLVRVEHADLVVAGLLVAGKVEVAEKHATRRRNGRVFRTVSDNCFVVSEAVAVVDEEK